MCAGVRAKHFVVISGPHDNSVVDLSDDEVFELQHCAGVDVELSDGDSADEVASIIRSMLTCLRGAFHYAVKNPKQRTLTICRFDSSNMNGIRFGHAYNSTSTCYLIPDEGVLCFFGFCIPGSLNRRQP